MTSTLFALAVLLMVAAAPALAGDGIDPALVGTWKLEWQRADFFWAIRPDGVYRMHGPGAPACKQRGLAGDDRTRPPRLRTPALMPGREHH